MKLMLEKLRTSALSNMEFTQLMHRHLSDLNDIDQGLLTDAPYNTYVQKIIGQTDLCERGLAQIRKNEETLKIVLADENRDKSVNAFYGTLKVHALSNIPEEVEASRGISILFSMYKNLPALNYEAETIGIDKLTGELRGPAYSQKISLLQMDRYVDRMADSNTEFKNLFGGRMVSTAMTEIFDMKVIRAELMDIYTDFTEYVLAMGKATDSQLFAKALSLLNTARKYYSDMLARRIAPKAEKEKPVV
ncbi:MAG TPA: DUF6261 family protein [Prolixibacteraceae bacterium]|nr:DUF6261 family protein [Prolixibacteraceae bacterium]